MNTQQLSSTNKTNSKSALVISNLFYRQVSILCFCIGIPTIILGSCGVTPSLAIGFGLIFGGQIPLHILFLQSKR